MTEQQQRSRSNSPRSGKPRAAQSRPAAQDPQKAGGAAEPAARPDGAAEPPGPDTAPARSTFLVPASQAMVSVLGIGDSLLRVIERSLPHLDIHPRGNEISLTGQRADVELAEQLFT